MKVKARTFLARCIAAMMLATTGMPAAAQDKPATAANEVVRLWPSTPPGGATSAPERTFSQPTGWGPDVQMVLNVSTPTMTVVRPPAGKANGAAMVVLPGGGFISLAWDMEGMEVAKWLAARGITAFVVKYRVALPSAEEMKVSDPAKKVAAAQPRLKTAIADASQAMMLVRTGATKWGIDPNRIGMMGFSAGAITTMGVVLEGKSEHRPNFAAPIYGMILADGVKAPDNAPPLFIVHAQNDDLVPVSGSVAIFNLWAAANRPADLHLYSKGGHGFGMRARGLPVDGWGEDFERWLGDQGLLKHGNVGKNR